MINHNGELFPDIVNEFNDTAMYNSGFRDLSNIKYILIHGMATTNVASGMGAWYVGSAYQASAHIAVAQSRIIGCLGLNVIAWHSGGLGEINNVNSVGIEHVNSSIADPSDVSTYLFDEQTLRNGAKTVAQICKALNLPPTAETIKPHRAAAQTACPQTLDMSHYIELVQSFYYRLAVDEITNIKKETEERDMLFIKFAEDLDGFKKDSILLLNFGRGTYHHVADVAELDFIKKQYPDIRTETVSKQYPAHVRYINGFKLERIR